MKCKLAIFWELRDGGEMANAPLANRIMRGLGKLEDNRPQTEDQKEALTEEIMRFL